MSRHRATTRPCLLEAQGHDTAQGRACDTAARPTTQPDVGHDTALWAPQHGTTVCARERPEAPCARLGSIGCALGAPNQFLGSVHCFNHCLGHSS